MLASDYTLEVIAASISFWGDLRLRVSAFGFPTLSRNFLKG